MASIRRQCSACFFVVLLVYLSFRVVSAQQKSDGDDLYELLGVSKTASVQEIKRAYRRKALDTHPDKRTDVPHEDAATEFHKVVHAFEILSDPNTRRRYDRTGNSRHHQQQQGTAHFHSNHQHFWRTNTNHQRTHQRRKARRLTDRFDVKQAMSRVLNIVSLSQLKTVMLDDNGLLERNLLMCFVTPQEIEGIADNEIAFPYPFAHMSEHGIWWEDLLQTVKIRYIFYNEITNFLGVPSGDEIRQSKKPLFLFGRRGEPLSSDFARIQTATHVDFENWVWKQIEVLVTFVNHHTHPVEAYWMSNGKAKLLFQLKPGESNSQNSMLSHEWWFRDARVDMFPGEAHWGHDFAEETMVAVYKITNDASPQIINIQPKSCLDFSHKCDKWKKKGDCNLNIEFMRQHCRLTCYFCNEKNDTMKMKEVKQQNIENKQRRASHDEL